MKLKTERALYVLDSSAVIALVRREQGWEQVQAALDHSVISAVNLTESMTKLIRQGGEPRLVERLLKALDLDVLPWDEELAWASRDLIFGKLLTSPQTRPRARVQLIQRLAGVHDSYWLWELGASFLGQA